MEQHLLHVINALCEDVGTPRALAVKLLVASGEWAELQKLRVRPIDYNDSESYWKDCLVTDLLRKCDLDSGVDREAAAVSTFWACEARNATTNARLNRFTRAHLFLETSADEAVYQFITEWRKEVKDVLGNLPDTLTPRFSGGATYADTGLLITIPDKMSSTPTITNHARCLLPLWGDTSWSRSLVKDRPWASDPRTVRGNIFFTVPKDGKTFRGCCKEPSLNVSYQLDVGRIMKARLHHIGIDLRQGQAIHRRLAREASVHGRAATVDMSNASDTLCRVLPELVLPDPWLEVLKSLRATHTRVKGKWVRLEKFSSMGNGFTFELETLLFATLARTVIRLSGGDPWEVKCYGDDLIVPSNHYREVLAALVFFGFEPNMNKTFGEGPFRESCGGDFWDGTPVRAHYLERLPDEPQQWISLANGLRRVSHGDSYPPSRWGITRRAWFRALDPIPSQIRRCRGPSHLGDVVIHDDRERWGWAKAPRDHDKSWELEYVHCYVPVPKILPWNHWLPSVQLASCTLGLTSLGVTPRGGISGYKISAVGASLTGSWLPTPRIVH